jgi:hypothetical protein
MRMISAFTYGLLCISSAPSARADSYVDCYNILTFISDKRIFTRADDGTLSHKQNNKEIFAVKAGEEHGGSLFLGLRLVGQPKWLSLNVSRVIYVSADYFSDGCGADKLMFSDGAGHSTSLIVKVCWIGEQLIRKGEESWIEEEADWYTGICH